jgi:hypothetical protein
VPAVRLPSVSVTVPACVTLNAYELSPPGQTVPEKNSVCGKPAALELEALALEVVALGEVVLPPQAVRDARSARMTITAGAPVMGARSTA